MTAPKWATRPERQPRRASEVPADLRLVDGNETPRRRTRVLTASAAIAAVVGLFAIVCLHVLLSQGQFAMDGVEAEAEALRAQNERLRVTVAQLESPGRIVGVARSQLGMTPPTSVIPLGDPAADPPPIAAELEPGTTVADEAR